MGSAASALASALRAGVRSLVVLGHSRCEWVEHQGGEADADAAVAGMDRLLRNVRQVQRSKAMAAENVVSQLEAIRGLPGVEKALRSGRLTLHGWLYLDETGLFMRYEDGRFVPAGTDA